MLPDTGIQKENLDILKESFIYKLGGGGVGGDTFPCFFSLLPCSPAPKLSVHTKDSLRLVVPSVFWCFLLVSVEDCVRCYCPCHVTDLIYQSHTDKHQVHLMCEHSVDQNIKDDQIATCSCITPKPFCDDCIFPASCILWPKAFESQWRNSY